MIDRMKELLESMERACPGGHGKIRFDVYGGDIDESFIRGTREGLIVAGLRMIRAGLEEGKEGAGPNGHRATSVSLSDLIHEESDICFDWIEITDDLSGDPPVVVKTRKALKKMDRHFLWRAGGGLFLLIILGILLQTVSGFGR